MLTDDELWNKILRGEPLKRGDYSSMSDEEYEAHCCPKGVYSCDMCTDKKKCKGKATMYQPEFGTVIEKGW